MKNLAILLIGLITLSSTTFASNTSTSESTARYNAVFDGSKYVFVENGIEFSLFPDGEFDFYIPEYVQGVDVNVNAGPVGISFNTGYDYDSYVQYDNYGAVIQIEDTPLYYDNYGRLSRAGDVRINYRNNRITRVGGLYVHYNNYGVYSHYTGFINAYNRSYVFHPYHNFFYRPLFNRCLVWTTPYRKSYTPVRYSYRYHRNNYYRGYSNGYVNGNRKFIKPRTGRVAHTNGRRGNVDRSNRSFRKVNTTSNRNRTSVVRNSNKRNNASRSTSSNRNTSRAIVSNNTNRTKRVTRVNTTRTTPTTKPSTNRNTRTTTKRSVPSRSTKATNNSYRSTPKRTTQRSSSSRTKVASTNNTNRSSKTSSRSTRNRRS